MLNDLLYALRGLRRDPWFAAAAILTLALGIGANTAAFSLVRAVFLAPLPFPDAGRLVSLSERRPTSGAATLRISGHEYAAWRDQSRTLDGLALYRFAGLTLTGRGDPDMLDVQQVSGGYFDVLQLGPALGRTLVAADERPGAAPVLILSDGLWRRRFASDPSVVGRSAILDGTAYTIAGVMPHLPAALSPDAWTNLDVAAEKRAVGRHNLYAIGRLRADVARSTAQEDLESISARLAAEMPGDNAGHHSSVVGLREEIVGGARSGSRLLTAAVAFLLLIGCVNVANLLLTRGAGRYREISVRLALGASRSRIARQLVVESAVVATIGGLAGVLVAAWIVDFVPRMTTLDLPLADAARLDWRTLGFAAVLSMSAGLLAGLAPALRASRADVRALREGSRVSEDRTRTRLRGVLVGAEVALTMALLIGWGVTFHSFLRLAAVNPGFGVDQVVVAGVDLPAARYGKPAAAREFYDRLLAGIAAVPGVRGAAATSNLPLGGADNWTGVTVVGSPAPAPGQTPSVALRVVTADYFRVLDIPVLRGRAFDEADARRAIPLIRWYPQQPMPEGAALPQPAPVAVISESAAHRLWPGEDPVGRKLRVLFSPDITVVGVVGDVRHGALSAPVAPTVYLSQAQEPNASMSVVVRTERESDSVVPVLRQQLTALDAALPIRIRRLGDVVARSVATPKFYAGLTGLFGAAALGLAFVGIVGVVGYAVQQRTREIGVRMALGASPGEIVAMLVKRAMQPVGIGIAIGVPAGVAVMRLARTLLFESPEIDVGAVMLTTLLVIVSALLACWLPARRAWRVDPIAAIRTE